VVDEGVRRWGLALLRPRRGIGIKLYPRRQRALALDIRLLAQARDLMAAPQQLTGEVAELAGEVLVDEKKLQG